MAICQMAAPAHVSNAQANARQLFPRTGFALLPQTGTRAATASHAQIVAGTMIMRWRPIALTSRMMRETFTMGCARIMQAAECAMHQAAMHNARHTGLWSLRRTSQGFAGVGLPRRCIHVRAAFLPAG